MSSYKALPWMQEKFEELVKLEQERLLGHAYLVQGQKGVGKESLVKDFSAYLFCQEDQKKEACGNCQACQLFTAGTHPDFKNIDFEEGASQIKIEQIRDSRNFLANTPLRGKYKVLLIHSADKMNINAANALLKNLEEPAAGSFLFLLSHQPGLLLPTIRSRCQQIKIPRPNKNQALLWLRQHIPEGQAELCLELANGAPLKALTYADEDRQQERREVQKRLLELLRSETASSEAAKSLGEYLIEDVLDNIMLNLQQLIRQLHMQKNADDSGSSSQDQAEELQGILKVLSPDKIKPLHEFNNVLIQTRNAIQSTGNPNTQLLLESLCYQWVKLMKDDSHQEGLAV